MAVNARHLLEGLVIGFSVAAPVGPIGVLCIRTSLARGMAAGFAIGMGAAAADAAYGAVAGFGMSAVSQFLVAHRRVLGIAGGLFLLYLGARAFAGRVSEAASPNGSGLAALFASTVALTLSNPATILSFAMLFAAAGAEAGLDTAAGAQLVCGVFLGSAAWWAILSGTSALLRGRMTPGWTSAINRVSGAVLVGFGIAAIAIA
jgi:threonine/homoserine/homoserine lactone efflux protein